MGINHGKKGDKTEFYYPPNRLAERIVDAKGPSLQEMEAEAAERLAATQADYTKILEDSIQRMKAVMADDIECAERQRILFQEAHDIKGQAPLFGYPLVANVAICICVAIMEAPEKLAAHDDLLQLHLAALEWAFTHQDNKQLEVEKAALVQSLRDAVEQEG